MNQQVYSDNGAAIGNRTRVFRDCATGSGVEWMYGVDWASGSTRWYGYGMRPNETIERLIADGMFLSRIEDAAFSTV